ncbi:hypothetical protein ABIE78_004512 [Sinorhizobium fredii]
MQFVGIQVFPERGGKAGFTVEFVGATGEVVSVLCPQNAEGTLNRMNAVVRAKEILAAAIETDGELLGITGTRRSPAVPEGALPNARQAHDRDALEEQRWRKGSKIRSPPAIPCRSPVRPFLRARRAVEPLRGGAPACLRGCSCSSD